MKIASPALAALAAIVLLLPLKGLAIAAGTGVGVAILYLLVAAWLDAGAGWIAVAFAIAALQLPALFAHIHGAYLLPDAFRDFERDKRYDAVPALPIAAFVVASGLSAATLIFGLRRSRTRAAASVITWGCAALCVFFLIAGYVQSQSVVLTK